VSLGSVRHRLARASVLAGEEEDSVTRDELEAWRERLAVVAAHYAGAANVEARPLRFASLPEQARFSSSEAKELCSLWLQAAFVPIDSARLPAFFEFIRADLRALDSTGWPLPLPELESLPERESRTARTEKAANARSASPLEPGVAESTPEPEPLPEPEREPLPEPVAAESGDGSVSRLAPAEPEQPPGSWGVSEASLWRSKRVRRSELGEFFRNEHEL
jgi:hypothetical protein